MLSNLVQRLQKSRDGLKAGLSRLTGSQAHASVDLRALEAALLGADLGVGVVDPLMARLRSAMADPAWPSDRDAPAAQRRATDSVRAALLEWLRPCQVPLTIDRAPFVIMLLGVNGAGKTTLAAKLAERFGRDGRRVVLGAADTFRAAAVEQLQAWGRRVGAEVIAQAPTEKGRPDPAAVAFDAVQAGLSRKADLVCVDTAGRLQTKSNLMEELKKIARVMDKALPGAPHERLLVIDATVGQNGLSQARQFHDAVGVTGLAVTKLDGTAKGGIVVAIAQTLKLPIRYIGVGETADDLLDFDAEEFVKGLLGNERD
ncbi:MAG: signal recognition particle-docking protein FtsY [Nitrospirota bacterium]